METIISQARRLRNMALAGGLLPAFAFFPSLL